jgi:hypothetical protein
MFRRLSAASLLLASAVLLSVVVPDLAHAGVVNPDISVLGQPFMRWTDDPSDASPKRATFNQGEVEMVFDAYLNPYAKGLFITSLGEDGLELEEGYFTLVRGLPAGLQLKGGKYRVGFGKLNTMHPHAVPFAERPRVLSSYLPGDESLDEVGLSLSGRIPTPGTFSLTAAADWLQGDTFRIPREGAIAANDPLVLDPATDDRAGEARPAFVGNLSGFGQIGERSGYELALSATGGTNNVAANTRTKVYDAAGKLKLWIASNSYLLLQGELLKLDREDAAWDSSASAYTKTRVQPMGGYAYADYNFSPRFDAGMLYERFQQPADLSVHDSAVGAFIGYSLMEETTSFRVDWNHFMPGTPSGGPSSLPAVNTLTLRAIFSMGPHKAHQF